MDSTDTDFDEQVERAAPILRDRSPGALLRARAQRLRRIHDAAWGPLPDERAAAERRIEQLQIEAAHLEDRCDELNMLIAHEQHREELRALAVEADWLAERATATRDATLRACHDAGITDTELGILLGVAATTAGRRRRSLPPHRETDPAAGSCDERSL